LAKSQEGSKYETCPKRGKETNHPQQGKQRPMWEGTPEAGEKKSHLRRGKKGYKERSGKSNVTGSRVHWKQKNHKGGIEKRGGGDTSVFKYSTPRQRKCLGEKEENENTAATTANRLGLVDGGGQNMNLWGRKNREGDSQLTGVLVGRRWGKQNYDITHNSWPRS